MVKKWAHPSESILQILIYDYADDYYHIYKFIAWGVRRAKKQIQMETGNNLWEIIHSGQGNVVIKMSLTDI